MPEHIRKHCFTVRQVALAIARSLNRAGEKLNLAEIAAASLLHDISKKVGITTSEDHAAAGGRLLDKLGYTHIATIVQQHIIPDDSSETITAAQVVSYADKRVVHDKIVSLDERFDYLMQTYGKNEHAQDFIVRMKENTRQIEKKIRQRIDLDSCDLTS